jgi:UPF0755 protein
MTPSSSTNQDSIPDTESTGIRSNGSSAVVPDDATAGEGDRIEVSHAIFEGAGATAASLSEMTPRERLLHIRQLKKKRVRRRAVVIGTTLLVFAIIVTLITLGLQRLLGMYEPESYPGPGETPVTMTVKPGTGTSAIFAQLKALDVIASERGFSRSFNELSGGAQIQPGDYKLKTKMKNEDVVKIMIGNDTTKVLYVPVSGNMRINEVMTLLSKNTRIPLAQFQQLANDPKKFGLSSKAKNLEGYLAPGEYRFPLDSTAEQIVQTMVDAQKKILTDAGVTDADQQYLVLTKASIVEAEGNPKNYAIIAGALDNRVNRPNEDTGGFINSDATVTYGLGKRTLHLSDAQKQDKSNPYNTYANKGLPIGPIGSPEKAAIQATIKPQKNDYYYWVTINIKTGETLYAKTYAEHQVNEQKYLDYCAQNAGVCQ